MIMWVSDEDGRVKVWRKVGETDASYCFFLLGLQWRKRALFAVKLDQHPGMGQSFDNTLKTPVWGRMF